MDYLKIWFQNCLQIREKVQSDESLQERIRKIQENKEYDRHGESAEYKTISERGYGLKCRSKESRGHKAETSLSGYLWTPEMPFSSFIVIVGENKDYLFYLMEDFSPLYKWNVNLDAETRAQIARIQAYAESKGIGLRNGSMGYSPEPVRGWSMIVNDMDPVNSFNGDFRRSYFSIFPEKNSNKRFPILHDIFARLNSREMRFDLI